MGLLFRVDIKIVMQKRFIFALHTIMVHYLLMQGFNVIVIIDSSMKLPDSILFIGLILKESEFVNLRWENVFMVIL
jgi:hypothetical protein